MLNDEDRYRILKRLAVDPDVKQRELAHELGISLGKVNYCLKALLEKGLLKVKNFRNSENRRVYMYYLTPQGIREKSGMTLRFFRQKTAEYEALKSEIEELQRMTKTQAKRVPKRAKPARAKS